MRTKNIAVYSYSMSKNIFDLPKGRSIEKRFREVVENTIQLIQKNIETAAQNGQHQLRCTLPSTVEIEEGNNDYHLYLVHFNVVKYFENKGYTIEIDINPLKNSFIFVSWKPEQSNEDLTPIIEYLAKHDIKSKIGSGSGRRVQNEANFDDRELPQ